jgi:hypothetical protein
LVARGFIWIWLASFIFRVQNTPEDQHVGGVPPLCSRGLALWMAKCVGARPE